MCIRDRRRRGPQRGVGRRGLRRDGRGLRGVGSRYATRGHRIRFSRRAPGRGDQAVHMVLAGAARTRPQEHAGSPFRRKTSGTTNNAHKAEVEFYRIFHEICRVLSRSAELRRNINNSTPHMRLRHLHGGHLPRPRGRGAGGEPRGRRDGRGPLRPGASPAVSSRGSLWQSLDVVAGVA